MAVPRQEFLHAQRSRAVHRADHDDVTQIARDQSQPALDERPHQDLAQLRVGLDEREQLLAIELDHFAGLADAQAPDRAAPADHVGFAGKLPGVVAHDQRLGRVGRPQRLDFAAEDDKKWHRSVARFDQHLAARGRPTPSVGRNPRHLLRCERRKHALGTRDRGATGVSEVSGVSIDHHPKEQSSLQDPL